jgi:hypothetical protein
MIRTYDDDGYGFPPVQLYDMGNDPYQTSNLADVQPALVDQCFHTMDEWVDRQRAKDGWPVDPLMEVLRERQRGGS